MPLDTESFAVLARRLEARHDVFGAIWDMGRPAFTEEIETACVDFDREGEWVRFLFNPAFWASLDPYGREFVVCHEVLHVVLAHGVRTASLRLRALANIAADLVVNHLLVERYGFVRSLVEGAEAMCWRDTVFEVPWARDIETLEGYFQALQKTPFFARSLVDVHVFARGAFDAATFGERNARFGRAFERRFGRGSLREMVGDGVEGAAAGWGLACGTLTSELEPGMRDVAWGRVLRRAERVVVDSDRETWSMTNRRLAAAPLTLPHRCGERHEARLAFFIDTSGSCWMMRSDLARIARSLEARAQVSMFAFDTEVTPLEAGVPRLRGGGGTDFTCIERALLAMPKYPNLVVVLTDGWGRMPQIRHPRRWHWLLTGPDPGGLPAGSACSRLSLLSG